AEQLQHFGGLMPEQGFLPPLLGPTEQYRRKARLACKYVRARERVFVGFREAASHYVTDVSACAVLDERVSRLLPALSVMMTGLDAREKIPQIEVAVGDDEIAFVVRHLEPLTDSDRQAWVKFCQSEGITLYLQSGGVDTVCQIWPEWCCLPWICWMCKQRIEFWIFSLAWVTLRCLSHAERKRSPGLKCRRPWCLEDVKTRRKTD
ncbi:MAG: hypothetical protein P8104_04620, partial [Gammaproteobacteria bacterium]